MECKQKRSKGQKGKQWNFWKWLKISETLPIINLQMVSQANKSSFLSKKNLVGIVFNINKFYRNVYMNK